MNQDSQFFLHNLWLWKCGLEEVPYDAPNQQTYDLDELSKTEWSDRFEELMRNRLLMGAFRYGRLHDPNKKTYKRVQDAIRRLTQYLETGNDELLVDAANLCLCEFEVGNHPNKHFESVDDGEHCK